MFKKLKGQVEVSKVKGETKAMSKSDRKKLEEQIIFGGLVGEFEADLMESVSKEKFDSWVKRYPKDQPGVAGEIASNDAKPGVNKELLRDVRGTIVAKGGKPAKNISKV